jgi:hypothetical protein
VLGNTLKIFRAVESSFLQMVQQALHRRDGGVDGRRFMVAADCEEEETNELETVVQGRVQTILFVAFVDAQAIESFDLVDQAVVKNEDIL